MAARDTTKELAVYVIGISGNCSKSYIGCGKSCLCRQYMYNEYVEESYSTLLHSEFDSCVINQQHVIYWGKKEETYKEMTKGQCSFEAKVKFEVFEHTIFYQDGTNQPFPGYEKYESRVFTPLKSYLGKYAFKSRDEVLNPEDYGSKKFHSRNLPMAYLYVVDVSQSCCVFEEQMQLMSKLVKCINKKKQSCVVVASKFDTQCRANVVQLESLASKLKVPVIQCSAKYNTNVDTAFKYLAVKALSLKKLSVNVLTHAQVAAQKPIVPTKKDTNIDVIPHISMANKSSWNMPQDPTKDYDVPPDCPKENAYVLMSNSNKNDNEQEERSKLPSNPTVLPHSFDLISANNSAIQPDHKKHFYEVKRSTMPLPHTPLESSFHNLLISSSSTIQLPADSQDTEENVYYECDEHSSSLSVDFESPNSKSLQKESLMLTHTKSKRHTQKFTPAQGNKPSDISKGCAIEQLDFESAMTAKVESPYIEMFATSDGLIDDDEIYEWCGVEQSQKLSSIATIATTSRSGVSKSVGHSSTHRISQLSDRDNKVHRYIGIDHKGASRRGKTYNDTKPGLQHVDSTSSSIIHMYKVNNPSKKRDSHVYAYDYVHHSYVQMCKHRRRCIGVPPQGIKRAGYQPSIHVNTNPVKEHNTYVNFKFTESYSIPLPPRKSPKMPTPKQDTNHKPPMPPRNIPRPGCYLSAPSAVAKVI